VFVVGYTYMVFITFRFTLTVFVKPSSLCFRCGWTFCAYAW